MFIVAKTIKEKEFVYDNNYSIKCKNESQASKLAKHLNNNNDTAIGKFKLKDNEIWWVYEIDMYDSIPHYKLKTTKNKISLVENW